MFTKPVELLSNVSPIIATYAEVLKYTVKFDMSEEIILKIMIPNFFVQYIKTKQVMLICFSVLKGKVVCPSWLNFEIVGDFMPALVILKYVDYKIKNESPIFRTTFSPL